MPIRLPAQAGGICSKNIPNYSRASRDKQAQKQAQKLTKNC